MGNEESMHQKKKRRVNFFLLWSSGRAGLSGFSYIAGRVRFWTHGFLQYSFCMYVRVYVLSVPGGITAELAEAEPTSNISAVAVGTSPCRTG